MVVLDAVPCRAVVTMQPYMLRVCCMLAWMHTGMGAKHACFLTAILILIASAGSPPSADSSKGGGSPSCAVCVVASVGKGEGGDA